MQYTYSLAFALSFLGVALGCPEHAIARNIAGRRLAARSSPSANWTYDNPNDWNTLNPAWEICRTGTQQSPIGLSIDQGFSRVHVPTFFLPSNAARGTFGNWGYGPEWDIATDLPMDQLPTMRFDNTVATMASWHTHTPAEHSVDGNRAQGEMHIVWNDINSGSTVAVTGLQLDQGQSNSGFFDQLGMLVPPSDTTTARPLELDFRVLLGDGTSNNPGFFSQFWTYQGSLTTPPCDEGIRWFVASGIHRLSADQMQMLQEVSRFSARPEQPINQHHVNQ